MGRSNTSAWPGVGNEVGCHRAEWGQERERGPWEGYGESCQGACQAGLTELQKPEPRGGSDK